jgi:hypothetical protein
MKKVKNRDQLVRFVTPGGVTAVIDSTIPMEVIVELRKRFERRVAELEKRKTPQV